MTAQLLMSCGLTDKHLPSPLVLIRESTGTDGSFLVSSILGQQLKASPQSKIVLVCVHQSLGHYQCVGMRMGYNLKQICERGRVKTIDALQLIHENLLALDSDGGSLALQLFQSIQAAVQSVPAEEDLCILIDDVSIIRSLTDQDDLLLRFVEKLKILEQHRTGHFSCVVKLNSYDVFPVVANNLDSRSALTINLDSLKSGRFKEVDGRITISRPGVEEDKVVLYKVNDRNVKTFAKGFL